MIETVILDLDDTLYDEIDYCKSGFAAVAEHLAASGAAPAATAVFEALWGQFQAGNRTKTFNAALDALGIEYNDSLIRELIQFYRNHSPKISLPAESRETIDLLKAKYRLALLTDGFMPAQRLKVEALEIEGYFEIIVYTEELGREFWKPSPAGFEKIIQTLNADPKTTTYVADNLLKDFIAPNKLGMTTIQLIRPNHIHTQISDDPNAKPDHALDNITDLRGLLKRL
ncbi:MAG: HAD family hydrolase [Planctomycetota bacterium]|jgi:putative hydrolase of the HAD superfamily